MRAQVVLVLVVVGLVALVTPTPGIAAGGAGLRGALQQAILEVVEDAHAWDILRVEATDEGIEGVITHHGDPDIETGDAALGHRQTAAQHTDGLARRSSLVSGVEDA